MVIYVTLLILALVGALIWALSANGSKIGELGRILYFCALFALLYRYHP